LERWTEAYDLHRQALRNRSQASFHQLRIGIKRLRYIVENFLPVQHELWSADLKELQDLLGDVHDLDVLWMTATQVNAFAGPESRQRWHGIVLEARERRITRYRERMVGPTSLWRVWRAELPQGEEVRAAATLRLKLWASFLDPDFAHSEHVSVIAGQLFDGLQKLGFTPSDLAPNARSILLAAALLHDVGRARHEKGHHKTSYRLVRRLPVPLGWQTSELQLAATVARFHRGALPQGSQKSVRDLAPGQKTLVRYLAGILRLANALDVNRDGQVKRLMLEEGKGTLLIAATGYSPWARSAEEVASARHLLEVVLRRPILVKTLKPSVLRAA
jgi:exopolyphosphatase/guanosine-5'-triphosphate,3'-diphosphate pyrophosphatase